jgi:glycosyltransferase involved in cell wall biosynthesis
VTHVITALTSGGAEEMLYRLLLHTDRSTFEHRVVSLTNILEPTGNKIEALGVPVHTLGMRPGVPDPRGVRRLARWLRLDRPDVVQTWMYQADLVGGLAASSLGIVPVVWGIHSTYLDPQSEKQLKIWVVRANAWLSRWLPVRIVCCAEASMENHAQLGYVKEKMLVIANGCSPTTFSPDPEARQAVRKELGIKEGRPLIGLVARFDSPKDHHNFVQAAALLRTRVPGVQFLLCGDEITWDNRTLASWIDTAGIRSCCHLLGRRQDIPRLTAALDIATSSSSYGEAWPLVIGEAMACGVPCVVTDVGDSALIVGDTGWVVPPKDPEALADAWQELLTLGPDVRACLGLAARERIKKHFSLASTVAEYQELYKELALGNAVAAPLSKSLFGKGEG